MIIGKVNFIGFDCVVEKGEYQNGRPALQLIDANDGAPVATATVNMPGVDLEENHVFIKDYSENEGMLDALVHARIVEDTGIRMPSGFIQLPLCRLL